MATLNVMVAGVGIKFSYWWEGSEFVWVNARRHKVRPQLACRLLGCLYSLADSLDLQGVEMPARLPETVTRVLPKVQALEFMYERDNDKAFGMARVGFLDYGVVKYDPKNRAINFWADHADLFQGEFQGITDEELELMYVVSGVISLLRLLAHN